VLQAWIVLDLYGMTGHRSALFTVPALAVAAGCRLASHSGPLAAVAMETMNTVPRRLSTVICGDFKSFEGLTIIGKPCWFKVYYI
jgi:hypothetical protein